jgi:HEAT repeat protein
VVESRIRAGNAASRLLVDGLAAAESGDAQQALVRLMQDEDVDRRVRMRAATGLARVDHPEPTSVRAMFSMLNDPNVAEQAVLGIGSMGRRLREQRDLQIEIADTLRKVLQGALTVPKRLEALRAVSNSGNDLLFGDVRPYLAASEATVRARAVEGLRHMQGFEVESTLVDVLRGDPSADVQVAVLQAAQTRGFSKPLSVGVAHALAHSQYEDVRQRAITLARAWQEREPALRAALERTARDDKDPEVRQAAAAALK